MNETFRELVFALLGLIVFATVGLTTIKFYRKGGGTNRLGRWIGRRSAPFYFWFEFLSGILIVLIAIIFSGFWIFRFFSH